MGFLIASDDGRLRICVATAAAAAHHLKLLRASHVTFHVTDLDGNARDLSELVALSDSLTPVPAMAV